MKPSTQRVLLGSTRRLFIANCLLLLAALSCFGVAPCAHAKAKPKTDPPQTEESDEPPAQPDIGVVFDPADGEIEQGGTVHVSFPGAMVSADLIDAGNQPAPVRFDPPVEGKWFWKSQTDGEFEITGGLRPGQKYKITLAPGLKMQDGKPLQAPAGWVGATLTTAEFTVSTEFNEKTQLAGSPQVVLTFTYPVRLSDAAEHIWFQDRDSAARIPAELSLREEDNGRDLPTGRVVRVSPRDGQLLPL
ncbi:MAG: hypothetical protein JO117_09800, partial [Verrucomicrobia bacterium]|nr:hypothetical protein [Verrucomicrobiota bacterium]